MLIDLQTHQEQLFNNLITKLQKANTRFVINYGGAGSSKSYTQTQHEIIKCLQRKEKLLVIRKVNNTLKDSVISLFTTILNNWGLNEIYSENKSLQFIQFANGSQILFKGMDDPEKIKSIAGITRVWIEEASELTKDDFMQLNLRLRGADNLQMTLTFNPIDEEHWIKKHFFENHDIAKRTTIIKTTYKDNKFIDEAYKQELESYQLFDKNYYKIYALGEWGGITEGRIFPIWEQVDKFPEIDGFWYGLDFGFSNDPTAVIKTMIFKDRLYIDEVIYQKGLTNADIATLLKESGYSGQPVICDSAEPKSILELRQFGINTFGADKKPGSIMAGIDFLKRQKILVTSRSLNIIRENRYYQWKQDKNGIFLNQPMDWMNHCFHENTLIETESGLKKIKHIRINEYIINSFGLNKVISNGITGYYQIFEFKIYFAKFVIKLKCTENHLIYTDKGWIQISNLAQGMTVFLSRNLINKSLDYTQRKDILVEVKKGFISKFGSILMEKYQKAFKYITKTKIHSTTQFKTLNVFQENYTNQNTAKKEQKKISNGLLTFIQKVLKLQKSGINQTKAGNGIKNTLKNIISAALNTPIINVQYAKKNLRQIRNIKNSAQTNAKANIEESKKLITSQEFVNIAVKNLHTPNLLNRNFVQKVAVQKVEKRFCKYGFVYDLTIENNQEFFANGLLVHNSIDSIRYAYSLYDLNKKSSESIIVNPKDLF